MKADIDRERADRFDITTDMDRQFTHMQDDLLKDIVEKEKTIEANRVAN